MSPADATDATEDVRERIAALPSELGAVLRPVLPSVADEILVAIRADVPEYRRPFSGEFGRVVRRGVEFSLGEFVAFVEDPARESQNDRMIEELGRGEVRAGRTLDALQSAYRTGARVAWRRFADVVREDGADAAVLVPLGEAIFAYIHRLAGLSVTGWAHEQSLRAGATQRSRDRLVRLVVGDRAPEDLDAAAVELQWTPPARLAVVVVAGADGPGDLLRIDPRIVAAVVDGVAVALVPARGVLARAEGALAGTAAVIGPVVGWADVTRSHRRASTLAGLVATGRVTAGDGPVLADRHLTDLVVHGDGEAADDLAADVLGPLDAEPDGRRERHLETLRAWLDHRGHGPRMAEALHLHPQTVRYRMARLRETLDVDPEDAEARFALELALRRRGVRGG
ncbi:helix-turn-helix domain-containing protein [Patulibacter sp. NPDC049589]|uniref:PucR family transcriptional regulator n=1 Tax=Patulibacter sp. NPDC049589 TaxID=3154731 RepID=UPI00343A617D